ncbi:MAG: DUF3540 domain-containing protein [Deltaproteobacteria bacterium]|nr:DUF3540 domain-containing protein [Deltaproteobacteria bacterium]MBN2688594.1 DUF3540 domain-containing protein [Deltaproteobacteria bacterium]
MNSALEKPESLQPFLEYGTVLFREGRSFSVQTSWGMIRAEQAFGCLVKPATGDIVLLSLDASGASFILSVLRRTDRDRETDLLFEGQVNLHVKDGGLSLTSDETLSIASEEEVSCMSRRVIVGAEEGTATISKLSLFGTFLESQIERVKHVADTVDTICRRLTGRFVNVIRFVKEEEEIQTGSTRYLVEDTLTMHSKNAVHMAEEIVAINAEQVHLG